MKVRGTILSVALMSAMLAANPAAAAPEETPQRGGSPSWALNAEPGTLDCGGTDTYAVLHAVAPFYSTLLQVDIDHYPQAKGDLAKSWKISEDGLAYTFELHEGVTFHDGTPLTSEDVKASFDRYRNPPAGVASFRKATYADIESIETPSPLTVTFKLKAANPAMLLNLASPNGCVYSAKKLAEDPKYPITNVLGSGPFKFVEYVKGSHISGVRFDQYFKKGLPYLDGFKTVVFSSKSAMVNAIEGGQVLGEFRTVTPADKKRLQDSMGPKVTIQESDWSTGMLLVFNIKKKPFDDIRVRQALSLAIDRHAASQGLSRTTILRSVGGLVRPGAPFSVSPEALEKLPGFSRDIAASREKAKQLLKEAGVENLKLELLNRAAVEPYTPSGVFVIDQLKQIGVEATHKQLETPAYREALKTGSYDVCLDFFNAVLEDPSLTLTKFISSDRSPENGAGAIDRDLDGLFEKQSRERDPGKREALIREFETRAITQGYQTPFLWWRRTVPLSSRVRGWRMSPSHFYGQDFAEIWLAPES